MFLHYVKYAIEVKLVDGVCSWGVLGHQLNLP